MKPHPRIRKTVKWGGAAVTALLALAWIASAWWHVAWGTKGVGATLHGGSLAVVYSTAPDAKAKGGWVVGSHPAQFEWWFGSEDAGSFKVRFAPGWAVLLPLLAASATAWLLDFVASRRASIGFCPKCLYDRTGLAPDAACPECGKLPA